MHRVANKEQIDSKILPGRTCSLDLLKVIAILGVITIHICAISSNPIGSFPWLSRLFWGSISRASVPIFLMCSGALLLDPQKELTLKKLFSKNLLRIIVAMIAWGMLYKIYHLIIGQNLTVSGLYAAVKEVLLFNQEFHLYYLHIMIVVYIFLPVTRIFVANAGKKELQYFLTVWFIFGILYPTVRGFWPFNLIAGIPVQWLINMTYASIGYGVLGHYLKYYFTPKRTVYLTLLLSGFGFIFAGTWYMSVKRATLYQGFLEGMSIGVALLAVGLFGWCLSKGNIQTPKPAKMITYLSKASFCIYLVHIFAIDLVRRMGLTAGLFPPIFSIPVVAAVVFAISLIVYAFLSKIPVVNRWFV